MKHSVILILALIVGLAGRANWSLGLSAQTENVPQTLTQMERDWAQAMAKRDQAALDRILAADYSSTNADGEVSTKAQGDADIKAGVLKYDSFVVDDMKVRLFGDTAVVTGRSTLKGSYKGKDISGQNRFTDVFVRRDGRWQAVTTHFSRVAKQ
jgi:ketosteroid isomerase-like protein